MFDAFTPTNCQNGRGNRAKKTVQIADLFAGAGGFSTGAITAAGELGLDVSLLAVNHWQLAVATHSKNHPHARHLCKAVDSVNPLELFPDNPRLKLLIASPTCTHHSNARGGKPCEEQPRADAWDLKRWIEKLYVENLLIENVKEFVGWGPLGANGRPLKSKKGLYFRHFINYLEILYRVEWRILNCADYGDATTRKRFFLIAKRGKNKSISFPSPTHASRAEIEKARQQPGLFGEDKANLKPWVPAREIIDWSLPGESVFGRKKPLSENTMRRIFAGLFKYGLKSFVLPNEGFYRGNQPRSINEPIPTVTSRGAGAVVEPFLMGVGGNKGQQKPRSADEPLPTVTATPTFAVVKTNLINLKATTRRDRSIDEPLFSQCTANHQAVVQAFIANLAHAGGDEKQHQSRCYELERPLPTIAGKGTFGLIETEAFLAKFYGGCDAAPLDVPIGTITANYEHYGLVEPTLISIRGGKEDAACRSRSVDEPVPTITAGVRTTGLAEGYIVAYHNGKDGDKRTYSLDDPLPTQDTSNRFAVAVPYLVRFNNNQDAESLDEPLKTLTTKDRYGICFPSLGVVLDIRFRMLQPHELAAAMGFPPDYKFEGTRDDKVKQIGNAVPVNTARALVKAILGEGKRK